MQIRVQGCYVLLWTRFSSEGPIPSKLLEGKGRAKQKVANLKGVALCNFIFSRNVLLRRTYLDGEFDLRQELGGLTRPRSISIGLDPGRSWVEAYAVRALYAAASQNLALNLSIRGPQTVSMRFFVGWIWAYHRHSPLVYLFQNCRVSALRYSEKSVGTLHKQKRCI